MNYCNFSKVIIARSSIDPESIEWWKTKQRASQQEQYCQHHSLANLVTWFRLQNDMISIRPSCKDIQKCTIRTKKLVQTFKTTKLFNKQQVLEKCKHQWWKTTISSKVFPGFMVPFVRERKTFAFSTRLCKVWGNRSIVFISAQICKWKDRKYNVQSWWFDQWNKYIDPKQNCQWAASNDEHIRTYLWVKISHQSQKCYLKFLQSDRKKNRCANISRKN